jgi:hypothetical protein
MFWLAIGGPGIVLAMATLYLFWLNYKAGKLLRGDPTRKPAVHHVVTRSPARKRRRKWFRRRR